MVKRQVKDLKELKDMTLKRGSCGNSAENENDKACSPGTKIVLRSSNRLRGKTKQAPEDRNIVNAKSPPKRTIKRETPSKKKAEDLKKKVVALKKGSRRKSKRDDNAEDDDINGTNKVSRSSNRLEGEENADIIANEKRKGKRKQAPQDRDLEKVKSPQKRRNIAEKTLVKRKSEDPKKSEVVASKMLSYDTNGTDKVLRSSNRLKGKENADIISDEKRKGKRKQAPQDRDLEKIKSPQKRRNIAEKTVLKRKSEDPKKSKVVASRKHSYGKSKRHGNAENDEEERDYVGTSNVSRSSNRLKGNVDADEITKGKRKREPKDRNTGKGKSAEKLTKDKVENAKKTKNVALRKLGRGKIKKVVSAENDKERIPSAGSIKSLRSSRKLNGNTKAVKGNIVRALEDKNAGTHNSPKKIAEDPQKRKNLILGKVSRGNSKRGDNAEKDEERSDSAGTSKVVRSSKIAENAESSQKRKNANNEKAGKKKLPKRKVVDVFKEKGEHAKVEKRKMPDRTCRSNSKTKK